MYKQTQYVDDSYPALYNNPHKHNTIEYRWHEAQRSYKWDIKYDHGHHSKSHQPDYMPFTAIDSSVRRDMGRDWPTTFAIEEVEWCIWHCRGRFARRYSTIEISKDSLGRSLNSMIFEYELDATAFKAYLIAKTNPWFGRKSNLIETEVGCLYLIPHGPFTFDYNNGILTPTVSEDDTNRTVVIQEWCRDNCQHRYIVSVINHTRYVWFENNEDAIHFKFVIDLVTNEQKQ